MKYHRYIYFHLLTWICKSREESSLVSFTKKWIFLGFYSPLKAADKISRMSAFIVSLLLVNIRQYPSYFMVANSGPCTQRKVSRTAVHTHIQRHRREIQEILPPASEAGNMDQASGFLAAPEAAIYNRCY